MSIDDKIWQDFELTGRVADYLAYKGYVNMFTIDPTNVRRAWEAQYANKNQRIDPEIPQYR
ncbi:MAG: hypothetical protein RSE07_04040 [Oscillospiraceae bacterium]